MSLSWCPQDNDLLLSCGKDNRTICWNPQTGEAFGEFPVVTNWTFETKWNPQNPSLLATASFDGKIGVQTIQNTKNDSVQHAPSQPLDGDDFFDKVQSQPQSASFSLQKPPKWLQRPCGASFGFGGKVVKFSLVGTESNDPKMSKISLSSFAVDSDIGTMTETFAKAMDERDLKNVCQTRIAQATLESEKTDWKVIETLIAGNPRKELINYLGIAKDNDSELNANQINGDAGVDLAEGADATDASDNKRLSGFFDHGQDSDSFLADLASTKGAKTNNPFHIYSESEPETEKRITQALLLGNFERAMETCLAEDRLPDAFMIAICGGQACMEKIQKVYFKKQVSGPKYLRLLASIVGKNLWDVVYNADIQNWREVMATLCTYANADEFSDLCEALGDRLEDQSRSEASDNSHKESASFCYIAGSKLEKVVGVWIAELEHNERRELQDSSNGSSFSIHARSLQNFIEKVTVFREVTRYRDKERTASSNWKLATLYEKYLEYADIVAAHGQLRTAEEYLNLLPDNYPAADVARNRVKQATKKSAPAQTSRQLTAANTAFAPSRPVFEEPKPPAPQMSGLYAPPNISHGSGSYAPQNPSPYAASAYQPMQSTQGPPGRPIVPPPPSFGVSHQGPPRTSSVSPAVPPPSKASNMSNWNDMPEDFFKPPTSRRGTPATMPPASNPSYPNQSYSSSNPAVAGQPLVIPKATPAPPPPPPKGPAPPPRTQTPQMSQAYQQQPLERSSSSTANFYAPPPTFTPSQQQAQPQRGPSPYNPPPAGAQPGPGRYAPVSNASQFPGPGNQSSRHPPPSNQFAPRQSYSGGPTDNAQAGQLQGPPRAPPMTIAQDMPHRSPSDTINEAVQQSKPPKPPTPKYRKHCLSNETNGPTDQVPAPGDRSHIASGARPIYDLLGQDMQRIKTKAPASFKTHVIDTEKRLNILFDHLNNETLLKPNTITDMNELAEAITNKDYEKAMSIHLDLITNRTDECGNWMVSEMPYKRCPIIDLEQIGVKRLINMSRATP